jgi:hypothetical protein
MTPYPLSGLKIDMFLYYVRICHSPYPATRVPNYIPSQENRTEMGLSRLSDVHMYRDLRALGECFTYLGPHTCNLNHLPCHLMSRDSSVAIFL